MSAQPPVEPVDLLRRHGVQVTAQRLAVLRAVSDRPHGTADEVAEAVRAEIGAISRQGVYDALAVLVDKGLLRRIQPAGSPTRYEHRVGDNHHHLVCRGCGRTVEVRNAAVERWAVTVAEHLGVGEVTESDGRFSFGTDVLVVVGAEESVDVCIVV